MALWLKWRLRETITPNFPLKALLQAFWSCSVLRVESNSFLAREKGDKQIWENTFVWGKNRGQKVEEVNADYTHSERLKQSVAPLQSFDKNVLFICTEREGASPQWV